MKYFTEDEFKCKCCGELPTEGMSPVLLQKLDELREMAGHPIIVTSGYRCPVHNAAIGGVENSQHVHGTAADIYCHPLSARMLANLAFRVGFDGVGVYDSWVHVDCRDGGKNPNYYLW